MNLNDLRNIGLDDIYWSLKFGIPRRKGTIYDLRNASFQNLSQPVFFLSTGRCGTKWFSSLIQKDRSCKVLHAPIPTLAYQGKMVYEQSITGVSASHKSLIQEIYLGARESYLRYSYKCDKKLIETNNYITFFAPYVFDLFPDAKFVHLYRHPGEFVRSGINRFYYTNTKNDDTKRIVPLRDPDLGRWKNYSQIQKISWLWNETNRYIESFKSELPENQCYSFNFNELTVKNVMDLLHFLGIHISKSTVQKKLNKKVNPNKRKKKEPYFQWPEDEKEQVKSICGELAKKYGYQLL